MSKLSLPIILAVLATAVLNILPIWLGRAEAMYVAFAAYALLLLLLSGLDRRVWGYSLVLTACNPSGGLAPLSYSLIVAILILVKEGRNLPRVLPRLLAHRWFLLLVLATGAALLSVPLWSHDPRAFLTDFKQYASRLVYLSAFCPALALGITHSRDALRIVLLACVFTVGTISLFYFCGEKGVPSEYVWNVGVFSFDAYMQIGNAYMIFTRTQICIVLAAVAAVAMASGLATFPRFTALLLLGVAGVCVYLMMQLASTGSAFAMVIGMGVAGLGYVLSRPSALRICVSIILLAAMGSGMVYAVFQTDNYLAKRIDLKQRAGQIDRMELWIGASQKALVTPVGGGWTTEFALRQHTHNDFLCYFLSFGWLSGLFYLAGSIAVGLWYIKNVLRVPRDATEVRAILLGGLAAITVYGANAMLDTLSAGIGDFQVVWSLILVPVTVCAAMSIPYNEYADGVSATPLGIGN